MADFRRCIFVLAALALLLGSAVTASAQQTAPFTCTSQATPLQMRAEGLTEKAGDFVLSCTGGLPVDPGINAPKVNIQVFLNTPTLTSRILDVSTNATEALLLVDEPIEVNQVPCFVGDDCDVVGVGSSTTSPYTGGAFNVWQGQLASPNSVVFSGVPIIPPGTQGGVRVLRITNIRANANALGIPSSGTPLGVTETLATSNGSTLPISSNTATQVVGLVQRGLIVTIDGASSFQQCFSAEGTAATVRLQKGFGAAFKPRNIGTTIADPLGDAAQDVVGAVYNTEAAYYNPNTATNVEGSGVADFGTRFKITFTAINDGVDVSVPLTIGDPTPPNLYAVLVKSESGPFVAATSGTVVPDSDGNAVAVYEVLQANTSSLSEELDIDVSVSYTADPGANIPALGTSFIDASFAPTYTESAAFSASDVFPIPRFAATPNPQPDFTINKCATHILFPFVTNQVGFDTGLAISNTSQDPYGTSTQTGTCQLNFYGSNAPAAVTTPEVAAGTTWVTTAMAVAPDFQGYVIADCLFQYAHGFAFVTRVGAVDVAMGYLPLIIPDPARADIASGFDKAAEGAGEMLGN